MGWNTLILAQIGLVWAAGTAFAADPNAPSSVLVFDNVRLAAQPQFDAVRPFTESFIAVRFTLAPGWHAYAEAPDAPAGMTIQLSPVAPGFSFGRAVFPPGRDYYDPSLRQKFKAYTGEFTAYIPFTAEHPAAGATAVPVEIDFHGALCTDQLCAMRDGRLSVVVSVAPDAAMDSPAFDVTIAPAEETRATAGTPAILSLPLAVLAGLILNIMPCVWPVLPVVIMRLLNQAGQSRSRCLLFGVAFSAGILLFFLAFACVNIVLRLGFGTVFSFTDLSQSAGYLIFISVALVILALFMFGVLNIGIPSSLAGKAEGGSGVLGSVGTGFLAAILATPCSFGILVAVLVWAQLQPVLLATLTIMLIGAGMALPYLLLTAIPGLLSGLPKPGKWMDIFKQAVGFILLIIAAKMIVGLPAERLAGVLYYLPVLAFAVWMWGSWVGYSDSPGRRWTVRLIAVALATAAGLWLLRAVPSEKQLIPWRPYDARVIQEAHANGRPVLIDFTAAWCFNCSVLEKLVYTRRDIAELIAARNVLPVKADVTLAEYPASAALKGLGESAIPLNVLLAPGREPVKFRGVLIGGDLKKALEALPQPTAETMDGQVGDQAESE